jgi:hypothetical protein
MGEEYRQKSPLGAAQAVLGACMPLALETFDPDLDLARFEGR